MNLTFNASRNRYQMEVAAPGDPKVLKAGRNIARFELSYFKGQRNRGIHAWVRVLEVEDHDTYTSETFSLFGDEKSVSTYLKPLPRKNDKQLALAAEKIDSLVPELLAVVTDASKTREDVVVVLKRMAEVLA